eukprot:Clim_evm98s243 gene=Clim_evmTU98s243
MVDVRDTAQEGIDQTAAVQIALESLINGIRNLSSKLSNGQHVAAREETENIAEIGTQMNGSLEAIKDCIVRIRDDIAADVKKNMEEDSDMDLLHKEHEDCVQKYQQKRKALHTAVQETRDLVELFGVATTIGVLSREAYKVKALGGSEVNEDGDAMQT